MGRSATVAILLTVVAQVYSEEPDFVDKVSSNVADQNSSVKLVNNLIGKLFDHQLTASMLQHTGLDSTTMGKPGTTMLKPFNGVIPPHRSLPSPHHSASYPLHALTLSRSTPSVPSSPLLGKRPHFHAEASTSTSSIQAEQDFTSLRNWPLERPRIVVLGGGFGGLNTALKLAELKWGGRVQPDITLVDAEDRFLFKPLMYELISGEATMDQVAPLFQDLIGNTGVRYVQQGAIKVVTAEPNRGQAGRVYLENGKTIDYDWLVLGVGATTNLDLAPGAKEYALPFATLHDVRRLEKELEDLQKGAVAYGGEIDVGVVGGGAGGVELAVTVAERLSKSIGSKNTKVSLYVSGGDLMEDFVKDSREVAKEKLAATGVTVYYNHRVEEVKVADTDRSDQKYLLRFKGTDEGKAKEVLTNLVLWTVGIQPVQLGFPGAQKGDPLTSEPTLRVKGKEREFAMGDVAGVGFPATAQVAIQQADYCAWNIYAAITGRELLNFQYTHLGNLVALGSLEGTATLPLPGIGDLTLKGPVASALRKAAYIYRQPTNQQRFKVASEWLSKPDMWLPSELPKDFKSLEKFNPFGGFQRP